MSGILTTPTITAAAIIFGVWLGLIILLNIRIKRIFAVIIVNLVLLGVCIVTALPFWNKLVYFCDRDNPYKQPLRTGTATIVVGIEPNSVFLTQPPGGYLQFMKKQEVLLGMEVSPANVYTQTVNKQSFCKATFELDQTCKFVGNPIYHLIKAEFAKMSLNIIPVKSKITDGYAIFTFNSSVSFKIPIPPQTMKDDVIIIPEIQKYFLGK